MRVKLLLQLKALRHSALGCNNRNRELFKVLRKQVAPPQRNIYIIALIVKFVNNLLVFLAHSLYKVGTISAELGSPYTSEAEFTGSGGGGLTVSEDDKLLCARTNMQRMLAGDSLSKELVESCIEDSDIPLRCALIARLVYATCHIYST